LATHRPEIPDPISLKFETDNHIGHTTPYDKFGFCMVSGGVSPYRWNCHSWYLFTFLPHLYHNSNIRAQRRKSAINTVVPLGILLEEEPKCKDQDNVRSPVTRMMARPEKRSQYCLDSR